MFVLDRIEGNFAVIEHESSTFNVPVSLLPKGAREGDILRFRIEIDTSATATRREKMRSLLQFDE